MFANVANYVEMSKFVLSKIIYVYPPVRYYFLYKMAVSIT